MFASWYCRLVSDSRLFTPEAYFHVKTHPSSSPLIRQRYDFFLFYALKVSSYSGHVFVVVMLTSGRWVSASAASSFASMA